ncbi:hypothetical protein HZC09_06745 [Candidatus Micrarchaeota archaeon]|nr:hypothetical protein [Candidatus Micrarchaeota archaeon]
MDQESQPDSDRPMYEAVCSDCGQPCQVPFQPAEGRPVYCRECFRKHRKPRHEGGHGGGGRFRRDRDSGY